ncbi:MAG: nitroreductase family protein [Nanoarchaeota archaeon]|nr:nitroreductase family protein [Nanoarchaeota archaeon]MBU1102959.1 nitroreductase family protein [Nanoarchaeota archaeon]
MEFEKVVRLRKSVRNFKKKKPSWKDILDAIDCANQGPFAGNNNHLRFLIVEKKKVIEDVADVCEQSWIKQARVLVLVCSDDAHLENLYGERGRVYSRQQAGAAIQTFLLGLANFGIDSCWVGAYSDDLLKEKLNIPQHIQVEAVVPVGFEEGREKKSAKKSLERTLYWEEWGNSKRPTGFEEEKEDYRPGK